MPTKYVMRAFKTSAPTGFVFWTVQDVPNLTENQSIYPSGDLQNITINHAYETRTPLAGMATELVFA